MLFSSSKSEIVSYSANTELKQVSKWHETPQSEIPQYSMTAPEPEGYSTLTPKTIWHSNPKAEHGLYTTHTSETTWYSIAAPEVELDSEPKLEAEQYSTPSPEPESHSTMKMETAWFSTPSPEPEWYSAHKQLEWHLTPKPESGMYTKTPSQPKYYSEVTPESEWYSSSKPAAKLYFTPKSEPEWHSTLKSEPKPYSILSPEPHWYSTPTPEPKWYSTSLPEPERYSSPGPESELYSSLPYKPKWLSVATPEPEWNYTLSPKPEPKWYSTPKSEPHLEPRPKAEPVVNVTGKAWGEISPEPVPEFDIARPIWGVAWPIHFIGFGILFAILMIFTLNSIIALTCINRREKFQRRRFFLGINIMLFYLSFAMMLSLLIDPYDSGEFIEKINFRGIIYLLLSFKYPCLTASFSLMQISFIEALKFRLYSRRLHSLRLIFSVIGAHFLIVFIIGLILLSINNSGIAMTVCLAFTLLLNVVFSIMSLHIGIKICLHKGNCERDLQGMNDIALTAIAGKLPSMSPRQLETNCSLSHDPYICNIKNDAKSTKKFSTAITVNIPRIKQMLPVNKGSKVDRSVRRIAILMMMTALFAIMMCIFIIFSMCEVYVNGQIDPWKWYIYQTFSRLSEMGMASTMAYVVRKKSSSCNRKTARKISQVDLFTIPVKK